MSSTPPAPLRVRADGGPLWLSRSLIVSGAVWMLLLGAALGASFGLWGAWNEIQSQRYADLEFKRTCFLLLEHAADHGVQSGAITALWFLILGLLVSAYAPVRVLFDPRELAELLVNRERLLRAQVSIAGAFLLAIAVQGYRDPSFTSARVYLLALLAALGILSLALIAQFLRRSIRSNDGTAQATAFAACAAMTVIVVLGFVVDGDRIWRPTAPETLAANLLLVLGAGCTFVATRRAVLTSGRSQGPATRTVLGGRLTRLCMLAAVLPALSPLVVRAAAGLFGHSGVTPKSHLNVVVIAIDTLRADCVDWTPPAAGARDRTPNLRKLAARGVQFSQAISQAPWTMPAFASILTGKYPLEHGAVSLNGILRDREVTLAEILREADYRTGSFVSNHFTDAKHGFGQGHDEFEVNWIGEVDTISSRGITGESIDFIQRHAKRPFYMFSHYMDPHFEYRDHKEWPWADSYTGWLKDQNDILNFGRNRHMLEPEDLRWIRDSYEEEIASTDQEIGRLLEALENSGVSDRTLILVVVDHGESFLDHGSFDHTNSLYEELVHVPLLVVLPSMSAAGSVRSEVVETRRVFSTVLDTLGIDFAAATRPPGLFADAQGTAPVSESTQARAFSVVWLPDAKPNSGKKLQIVCVRTPRWKLIHNLTFGKYELFDLVADPLEKSDVTSQYATEFADLKQQLDAWQMEQAAYAKDLPRKNSGGSDPVDRMKALGYM